MKTDELKRIPIWELLSHLGIEPVSKRGGGAQLLYHSPLRPDRNASFSVSPGRTSGWTSAPRRAGMSSTSPSP